jgi:restriction endonuclease S subunit
VKLKDIATIRTGLVTARKKASLSDYETINYKTVTLKSFHPNGSLISDNLDTFIAKEPIKETYLTQKDDVLIRLREPNIALSIDTNNIGLIIPSFVASIKVDTTKITHKFLTYYLNSTITKKTLKSALSGTSIAMIKTKDLEDLTIHLPSLQEQNKIVTLLDLATHELELLEALKIQKESYYASLLENIINKGDL